MSALFSRSPVYAPPLIDRPIPRLASGLIALQVLVTVVVIAGIMIVQAGLDKSASVAERSWVVQIAAESPETGARLGEEALAILRAREDIANARLLPRQAVETLLAPWFGGDFGVDFPLPVTLEVTARADHDITAETIRALLPTDTDYAVHGNAGWREPMRGTASTFMSVSAGLIGLVGLATAAAIVLATRAAVAAHWQTIDLLHVIGADDAYIVRRFASQALLAGGVSGFLGMVGGGLLIAAAIVPALAIAELDPAVSTAETWLFAPLALIPVCTALLCFATTWVTVTVRLRMTE